MCKIFFNVFLITLYWSDNDITESHFEGSKFGKSGLYKLGGYA